MITKPVYDVLRRAIKYTCGHCDAHARYDHCARCGQQLIDHGSPPRLGHPEHDIQFVYAARPCQSCMERKLQS